MFCGYKERSISNNIENENIKINHNDIEIMILSYNRKDYLETAIKSALNQTIKNLKITIVDNGSNSETIELIESFLKDNPNLNLYRQKENIPVIENMRTAVNLAQAPYMLMMHDDDILHPQYVEAVLNIISDNNNSISMLAPIPSKFFDQDKLDIKPYKSLKYRVFKPEDFLPKFFIHKISEIPVIPSITFKSEVFKRVIKNEFVTKTGAIGDNVIIPEAINDENVAIITMPLYYYRVHKKQESQTLKLYKSEFLCFLRYFREKLDTNNYTRSIYNIFSYYRLRKLYNSYRLYDSNAQELYDNAYSEKLLNKWNYLLLSNKIFKFFIQPLNHIIKKIYQNIKYNTKICYLEGK